MARAKTKKSDEEAAFRQGFERAEKIANSPLVRLSRKRLFKLRVEELRNESLKQLLRRQQAKRRSFAKAGGVASAARRARAANYADEADRLKRSGHEKHEIAAIVAKKYGVKPDAVRKALRRKKARQNSA